MFVAVVRMFTTITDKFFILMLIPYRIVHPYIKAAISYFKSQWRIQGGGGAPGPTIGKNMIFWRKIVNFHTKYPKNVRASLRWAQSF
jgi:hypothetical protein